MTKVKLKVKRIYTSDGTQLEKKYFLSQAITAFSGILILIPIVVQNIKDQGYTAFNNMTIGALALLGLTALTFCYSACLSRPKQIIKLVRILIRSNWGYIPLVFFYFTWAMNILKMITLKMSAWQIWPLAIIGFMLMIISMWFSFPGRSRKETDLGRV